MCDSSETDGLLLEGAHTWTPTMFIRLVQDLGVDTAVAQHLSATYGDRAFSVGKMAQLTGMRWPIVGKRIAGDLPVGRGCHVTWHTHELQVNSTDHCFSISTRR